MNRQVKSKQRKKASLETKAIGRRNQRRNRRNEPGKKARN